MALHRLEQAVKRLLHRLDDDVVERKLLNAGFEDVTQTIASTDVWIRAIKRDAKAFVDEWGLPQKKVPYWFEHHHRLDMQKQRS